MLSSLHNLRGHTVKRDWPHILCYLILWSEFQLCLICCNKKQNAPCNTPGVRINKKIWNIFQSVYILQNGHSFKGSQIRYSFSWLEVTKKGEEGCKNKQNADTLKKSNLLMYNLHEIKFTKFNWTSQWVLKMNTVG